MLVSMKPNALLTAADQTAVNNFLALLAANGFTGANCWITLWQEPNTHQSTNPFWTGQVPGAATTPGGQYLEYVQFYWTNTAKSYGFPLVVNPLQGYNQTNASVLSFYQTGLFDVIAVDFYGSAWTPPGNFTIDFLVNQANTDKIPFGVAEWGPTTNGSTPPSSAQWYTPGASTGSYVTYLSGALQAAKYGVPFVLDFNGNLGTSDPNNYVPANGTTYNKVPAYDYLFDTLTAALPTGGAGGGGGEYAAESALAISSLRTYPIVVGAGGPKRTSGGNSAVAGDFVMVTANGGAAATANTAGGAGGTGSSNTVHHDGGAGGAGGIAGGGGGGGGSSAGTSAGGNAGGAGSLTGGGAGGAAVTGGGPGGSGGGPGGSGNTPAAGPGGGGGARGATGTTSGAGADGQITLSSFTTAPSAVSSYALAPLAFSARAFSGSVSGNYALAPLAMSATGAMCSFQFKQKSATASGTGTVHPTITSSQAGSLLVATIVSNGTTTVTAPAGWALISSQPTGGTAGSASTWFYNPGGDGITGTNPGGITGAIFTGGGSDNMHGGITEWAPPAVGAAVLISKGTWSGGTGTTSFTMSSSPANNAGDLAIAVFCDVFSSATAGTFTGFPAGWTLLFSQGATLNNWQSAWLCGLAATTQTVTDGFSTSTNEVGWAGCIAVFTVAGLVSSAGGMVLAPLALAGTGNSGITAGNVVSNGGLNLAPPGFQSPSQAVTFPGQQLPVMVEILLNGTWTDITSYVYTRDGITISGRGRPDETQTAQPTQVTLTLNNRDGSFSPQNVNGQFYPFLVRNTQIRISVVAAVTALGANYNANGTGNGYRFWGLVLQAWSGPLGWWRWPTCSSGLSLRNFVFPTLAHML